MRLSKPTVARNRPKAVTINPRTRLLPESAETASRPSMVSDMTSAEPICGTSRRPIGMKAMRAMAPMKPPTAEAPMVAAIASEARPCLTSG